WGYNFFGQATPPAGTFTQVSAGYIHTCGVNTDGTVACWGYNGSGQSTPTNLIASIPGATVAFASSPNPSTFGQIVALTATLSPADASGTVGFYDAGTLVTSATISSGTATATGSSLTVASHPLTARYGGNASYLSSTSSIDNQVVNRAASSTSLTSAPNPSTLGQRVDITATVAPAGASG